MPPKKQNFLLEISPKPKLCCLSLCDFEEYVPLLLISYLTLPHLPDKSWYVALLKLKTSIHIAGKSLQRTYHVVDFNT